MDMSKKIKIYNENLYVYETHLHTSQGSACGLNTPEEIAEACKKAGYTGIFVTDHFFYGNTAVDRSLGWSDWVEEYCKGYERAKKKGDEIDLQVFFGWESTYQGNDFLIYGLDKEWLLTHPEIRDASIEEQYQLVHRDGGMVIHAHPFREEYYVAAVRLFPEFVDGVEAINATHIKKYSAPDGSSPFDIKAQEYAKKYNFPVTAGSDLHSVDVIGGGMAFHRRLESVEDYMEAVLSKKGILLPVEYNQME